jgi:carboxylesterase
MAVHLASNRSREDAVLLLHGLSGSPLEMQYLERRVRQAGFRAHNPSIPGCGFGTREDRFDTGTWRQWLAFVSGELDALSRDHERVYVAGLCIGAVLALRLAIERPHQVAGLALVSTTLAYDGWQMPWYRVLAPLAYHTPLRRMIAWPERHPFGLKNERLRDWVVRAMDAHGVSAVGAAYLPLSGIHEAHQLIRAVRRDIGRVMAPSLIMHAIEDDVASTRSAEFVALNIGSEQVRTILYRNSYHILTIDNDKQSVADETIGFFRGAAGGVEAERSDEQGEALKSKHLSIA